MGERVDKLDTKQAILFDLTGYLRSDKHKELIRKVEDKLDILTIISGSKTRPIEMIQDTLSIDDGPPLRQFQSKINECSDEGFSEYDKTKRRLINNDAQSLQSWDIPRINHVSDLETNKTLILSGNLTENARNNVTQQ